MRDSCNSEERNRDTLVYIHTNVHIYVFISSYLVHLMCEKTFCEKDLQVVLDTEFHSITVLHSTT